MCHSMRNDSTLSRLLQLPEAACGLYNPGKNKKKGLA